MVTVRRSTEEMTNTSSLTRQNVAILERPTSVCDAVSTPADESTFEEARKKMQDNLNRILNYDKIEQVEEVASDVSAVSDVATCVSPVIETVSQCDEDIRPTSTTMQFGENDVDQMKMELQRGEESKETSYRLNFKGKMVVAIYALALAVIMTLIVLNTGILARLSTENEAKAAVLAEKQAVVMELSEQIEAKSDEYVIEKVTGWGWEKR